MSLVVGIDIGGTNIKLGVVDEQYELEKFASKPTPGNSYGDLIDCLVGLMNEIKSKYRVSGVGVGCAGVVDFESGRVRFSPNIRYLRDAHLRDDLESKLKLPVVVDNDANMVCWGEYKRGAGKGKDNIVCLTLGTGIGGGLVLGGNLYRGSWGGGSELGHITIDYQGPFCGCGNRGCLEAFVGARAIENRARRLFVRNHRQVPDHLSPQKIGELASEGDEVALTVIRETSYYLGVGVSSLVNVFNPDAVIITGGVSGWGELLLKPLEEFVSSKAMAHLTERLLITKGVLANRAGVIGAALLLKETGLD